MPPQVRLSDADRTRAVQVEFEFTQPVLNDAEKNIVRRAVAFKLSIPFDNVVERKFDVVSKQVYNPGPGKLPLIMAPIYTNPNFPDMMLHCQMINTAEVKDYIKSKMSTFVATKTYSLTKYPVYTPFMVKNPELVEETKSSLSFRVALTNYGYIYAIAAPRSGNESSTIPSPYQIWKGYDSKNSEVMAQRITVLEPNINYTFTFDQLNSSTIYEVFVTAGSRHPGFPDLLGSGNTVSIESATKDDGSNQDESSWIQVVNAFALVAMCLLLN